MHIHQDYCRNEMQVILLDNCEVASVSSAGVVGEQAGCGSPCFSSCFLDSCALLVHQQLHYYCGKASLLLHTWAHIDTLRHSINVSLVSMACPSVVRGRIIIL
jgi:hypothetical protein